MSKLYFIEQLLIYFYRRWLLFYYTNINYNPLRCLVCFRLNYNTSNCNC